MQRKGGQSKSPKKSEAAKKRFILERLKQGVHSDKDVAWIYERVVNSEAFAMDIMADIERVDKSQLQPGQILNLANTKNNVMKAIHGEKLKTENVNININSTIEEMERRLMGKRRTQ